MRETDFSTDYSGSESEEVPEIPVEDDINQTATPDHLSLSESTSNQTGKGSSDSNTPLEGCTNSKVSC